MLPRLIAAATYADLLRARRLLAGMGFSGSLTAAVHELGRTLEALRLERDAAEREAARFRPKPLVWSERNGAHRANVTPGGEVYAHVVPGHNGGWTVSIWVRGSETQAVYGWRHSTVPFELGTAEEAKAKAEEMAREVLYG